MGNALGILVLLWQAVPGAVSVECLAVEAQPQPVRVLRAVGDGWQEESASAHAAAVRHCARTLGIVGVGVSVGDIGRASDSDAPAAEGFFRKGGR